MDFLILWPAYYSRVYEIISSRHREKGSTVTEKSALLSQALDVSPQAARPRSTPITSVQGSREVCLQTMWSQVASEYFPSLPHLHNYLVTWSARRQKRTLASVNLTRQRVLVAQELNDPFFFTYLPALLYHEMCHAVISTNVNVKNGRRQWHGKPFKLLEQQHPGIVELDRWIKAGGWRYAIARHRARDTHRRREERAG